MIHTTTLASQSRAGRRQYVWELNQQGMEPEEIAKQLALRPTTIYRWLSHAAAEASAHAPRTRGRKRALSLEQRQQVPALLARGARHYGFHEDFWTYERVQQVMAQELGVNYSIGYVRQLFKQWSYDLPIPDRRTLSQTRAREQRRLSMRRELEKVFGFS
jgi:transposase